MFNTSRIPGVETGKRRGISAVPHCHATFETVSPVLNPISAALKFGRRFNVLENVYDVNKTELVHQGFASGIELAAYWFLRPRSFLFPSQLSETPPFLLLISPYFASSMLCSM